jgi:hypothetical protein
VCNANIYFNEECLKRYVTPRYAKFKMTRTSPASKFTEIEAQKFHITDEIKLLYTKKQNLHQQAYQLHTFLSNTWDRLFPLINNSIQCNLENTL